MKFIFLKYADNTKYDIKNNFDSSDKCFARQINCSAKMRFKEQDMLGQPYRHRLQTTKTGTKPKLYSSSVESLN